MILAGICLYAKHGEMPCFFAVCCQFIQIICKFMEILLVDNPLKKCYNNKAVGSDSRVKRGNGSKLVRV